MWRPDDWNNPYPRAPFAKGVQVEAYEDGADAILKAVTEFLQKEYPAITTWQCWPNLIEGRLK